MFRAFAYVGIGWLLLASVPGLASVFSLTVMLPSTTAVVLCHVAFSNPRIELGVGLTIATALGYLEDLHQGAPGGSLTLAHSLSFLALHRASLRLALPGFFSRSFAAVLTVGLLDLLTWAILSILADAYGLRHATLNASLWGVGWHALATMLVAYPIWWLFDRLFRLAQPRRGWPDVHLERMR